MSKLPFFLFSSLLASTSALAFDADQRCTAQPSCESMGYSKSAKSGCSQIIKCPFDLSYTLCLDCSVNTCSDGTMTEAKCSEQNGVLKDDTIDSNGCGECLTCDSGSILYKRNTLSKIPEGYSCTYLNVYKGSIYTTDICCTSCEPGCPEGTTYITSADEITPDISKYCIGTDIELTSSTNLPSKTIFYESTTCTNKKLTIATSATSKTIVSYVYTIINNGHVGFLELNKGGEFKSPMACGSYTITSGYQCYSTNTNCQVKLSGKYDYYFNFPWFDNNTRNLPSIVTCSLEGGNPNTEPTLLFQSEPAGSGYLFSGSQSVTMGNGASCSLGTATYSNCQGIKCYTQVTNGNISVKTAKEISNYNGCQ